MLVCVCFDPHVVLFFVVVALSAMPKASVCVCVSERLGCMFQDGCEETALSSSTPVFQFCFYYFISGAWSGNAAALSVGDGFGRRTVGVVSSGSSRLLSSDVS